jgi:hypothetical protein
MISGLFGLNHKKFLGIFLIGSPQIKERLFKYYQDYSLSHLRLIIMKSNKIFRLSSLRTSIHLDGYNVTHYQELHKFSSEAEAEAFFNESIQELLIHGWYDIESVPVDENNKDFTPDELYGMFLELKNQVDEFANAIIKPSIEITPYSTTETTLWQSKFVDTPRSKDAEILNRIIVKTTARIISAFQVLP